MELFEQEAGGVTILEPHGRINSVIAKEFGEHLSKVLNGGHYKLVIDLHNVTYICSSGFRQLLIVKNSTQSKDGRLALCRANVDVKRLFNIGGFDELLPIHETREDGIASVQ
jgi:anti-sigma B factor antagonist